MQCCCVCRPHVSSCFVLYSLKFQCFTLDSCVFLLLWVGSKFSSTGSSACTECGKGSFSPSEAAVCTDCPGGLVLHIAWRAVLRRVHPWAVPGGRGSDVFRLVHQLPARHRILRARGKLFVQLLLLCPRTILVQAFFFFSLPYSSNVPNPLFSCFYKSLFVCFGIQ